MLKHGWKVLGRGFALGVFLSARIAAAESGSYKNYEQTPMAAPQEEQELKVEPKNEKKVVKAVSADHFKEEGSGVLKSGDQLDILQSGVKTDVLQSSSQTKDPKVTEQLEKIKSSIEQKQDIQNKLEGLKDDVTSIKNKLDEQPPSQLEEKMSSVSPAIPKN